MKTTICVCLITILSMVGCSFKQTVKEGPPPTITVSGPETMDKKAIVIINGTGFEPEQDINLLFTANDGMQSDIVYALDKPPKADKNGEWSVSWKCYDFIRRKMVTAGQSYRITATDVEYLPIAHTMLMFKK